MSSVISMEKQLCVCNAADERKRKCDSHQQKPHALFSGFRRLVAENWALLGYYAASSGNWQITTQFSANTQRLLRVQCTIYINLLHTHYLKLQFLP